MSIKNYIHMKKVVFISLIIVCFPFLFSSQLSHNELGSSESTIAKFPNWEIGDWWIIEIYYQQPSREGKWIGPVKWKYQVINIEKVNERNCFHIKVNSFKTEMNETLDLFFDTKYLMPIRAVSSYTIRGKRKLLNEDFPIDNIHPVFSRNSTIPYDFPVFASLKTQNLDRVQSEVNTFEVKTMGTTPTSEKISQRMKKIDYSTLEESFESLNLEYKQHFVNWNINYISSVDYISIELFRNNDLKVNQIWAANFPWWLLCKSTAYKAKLVDFRRKQGRKK